MTHTREVDDGPELPDKRIYTGRAYFNVQLKTICAVVKCSLQL